MFNWLDYLIIGFLIFGGIIGYMQGYKWQIYRILCLILAFGISFYFSSVANAFIARYANIEGMNYVGYAAIFFLTLIITFLLGILFAKSKVGVQNKMRIIGGVLGIVKNAIFCSFIVTCLWLFGTEVERKPLNNSIVSTTLRTSTVFAIYKIPEMISRKRDSGKKT